MRYETVGQGDEVVVLTHGLASSSATWSAQVEAFAPYFRVLTWDLRAHGRSGSPDEPCTLAALAGDLAAVVAAAGGGSVHALGHSAGGVITMRFAIDFPEFVSSLVLAGTASECNARAHAYYESLAETAEREGGAAVVRLLGTRAEAAIDPEPRGFTRVARAMGRLHTAPLTAELEAVPCPALVVVGEKDFLGVGGSVIISRRLPGARLVIVPGRGHAIFREDPAAFNQLVLGFLQDRL